MEEHKDFNPDGIGIPNGNCFGLPWSADDAEIVLIPVPWDVTTSYRPGTSKGPKAIIDASLQVDLYDANVPHAWKVKIATLPIDNEMQEANNFLRTSAEGIISRLIECENVPEDDPVLQAVNESCQIMNVYVETKASEHIDKGQIVGIIGGDHSVPYGAIKAISQKYDSFGILHIDAHADLREAYEGFKYSHASIFYNVMKNIPQVVSLCQVGLRDYCGQEVIVAEEDSRIKQFTDEKISEMLFKGENWHSVCEKIVSNLPENVYISFDIDGLSPELCHNTGTPVPGGLFFRQADYLLKMIAFSGKKIIGFDLCEVAPGDDEWDANVGARLLYKMCLYAHASNNSNNFCN
ncbi:MAG: agmatinase family protein [Bacteroidales bacterium]|nr:agmatinase family protein [Bacteroidales bacterium]